MIGGDVHIRIGRTLIRMRLDFAALCAFEAETGKPALAWIGTFERGDVTMSTDMRAMCWAAMLRHQPDATLEDAAALLDACPDALLRVLSAAMPDKAAAGAPPGKKARAPSMWRRFTRALPRFWTRPASGG